MNLLSIIHHQLNSRSGSVIDTKKKVLVLLVVYRELQNFYNKKLDFFFSTLKDYSTVVLVGKMVEL